MNVYLKLIMQVNSNHVNLTEEAPRRRLCSSEGCPVLWRVFSIVEGFQYCGG